MCLRINSRNTETLNSATKLGQVFFLQKSGYDIDPNIRIVGVTLWTHIIPSDYEEAAHILNDYVKIRDFTPEISDKLYQTHKEYLHQEIELAIEQHKHLVIVTHHLPSFALIHRKYKDYNYNYLFASHSEDLLNSQTVKLWVCGHSHSANRQNIQCVPVILNPRGYPKEALSSGFDPHCTFTIES